MQVLLGLGQRQPRDLVEPGVEDHLRDVHEVVVQVDGE